MLKQFYEKVLPSQGVYCVTAIDKNKNPYNRFAESLDELVTIIEGLNTQAQNIFVAPGSFVGHSRRADNSAFLRSFFIDMDVGDGKDYSSKEDALEALQYLLTEKELPPPIVVDSGGGIHAYWTFDVDVPSAEWKAYAEKFKTLVSDCIPIDMVVTADVSRIMRAPYTVNHKYATPVKTGEIATGYSDNFGYDFALFKEMLGEVNPPVLAVLAGVQRGLDEDTKEILKTSNIESLFDIIATKSMSGSGCNQIKYILDNAANLSEPLWHSGLSIARQCTDWEESIHEMSREYVGYNANDTLRKANETLGKPHSCDVFNERNPGGCDGCPFRGRITNPLALGRHLKEAPTLSTEDAVRQQENTEEVPAFPEALKPFVRGVNGGIYYLPPSKTDKNGGVHDADPILLVQHDFYAVKRMYSALDGESMLMRLHLPNDGKREFTIPMKVVYSTEKLKEVLASNGVSFFPPVLPHLMNYLVKWSQIMIIAKTAEQMRMQMGWTEDYQGFVVGHNEIRPKGLVVQTAPSPMVNVLARLLKPRGDYDKWKAAANKLNMPGFELHLFTLFSGFGSPLMYMTSTSGGTICLTGPSGNAKTGALYAALSIYGSPKELSVAGEKSATDNGLLGWLMGLKNITLGMDEVSNKKPEALSDLVHRISQGKGKIRMQGSINAVREIEQNASCIAIFTSNQSMYDKLTSFKAAPDGEVARIIEFTVPKPKPLSEKPELGYEIFDTFRENYGHAVFDYIAHIYNVGDEAVRAKVNKWIARFNKDFGGDNAYRFYANIVGASMAAGELAVEAGIIEADLERVYRTVYAEIKEIRDTTIKVNNVDYKALIGEFMDTHPNCMLIVNNGRITREPYQQLFCRVELDNGMYYISKTEFKKYLAMIQVNATEFQKAMTTEGVLTYQGKQRLSNGWSGMVSTPISVYGFKVEIDPKMFNV
jgi:hypothetical protein